MLMLSPSLASLGQKGHCSGDFGLLLCREVFHCFYLYVRTSLFERSNERSAFLSNGYALRTAVVLVLTSAYHAALDQLVKQTTCGRDRTSQNFRYLLDSKFTL